MTYWLCITNSDNWKRIKKNNVWGVPSHHQNTINKVKPGDKLLIYLKQERDQDKNIIEPKIPAVYEAQSKVYADSSKLFKTPPGMGSESFPLRIKLKPVKIFSKSIDFKSLIPKLKFITNKKKWTGHLMGKGLMRKAGANRVSEEANKKMVEHLEDYASDVARKATDVARHSGRKTVKAGDVKLALKK